MDFHRFCSTQTQQERTHHLSRTGKQETAFGIFSCGQKKKEEILTTKKISYNAKTFGRLKNYYALELQ